MCNKKLTEFGFSKYKIHNVGCHRSFGEWDFENKLLKIWNSTQRSTKINIWKASVWFKDKDSYIKSLGPNGSDWQTNGAELDTSGLDNVERDVASGGRREVSS